MYKYKNLCETNDQFAFNEKIDEKYLNVEEINKKISLGQDIIGRDDIYEAQIIDKTFPKYIHQNIKLFKNWIVT